MGTTGQILVERARADRAAGRLKQAARLYEQAAQSGDPTARAHRLRHAGEIRLELGDIAHAAALLETALDAYRTVQGVPSLDLANALRPLALLREAQGRRSEAREAWGEAGDLYGAAGVGDGVRECEGRRALLD
jgi:tetratricopeptide (TPR) repeat protein